MAKNDERGSNPINIPGGMADEFGKFGSQALDSIFGSPNSDDDDNDDNDDDDDDDD